MVENPLGAGEYGVVVDDNHCATGLLVKQGGVNRGEAGDNTIGCRVLFQVVYVSASTLGGNSQLAVFEEGVFIAEVIEVFSSTAITPLVTLGNQLFAPLVKGGF